MNGEAAVTRRGEGFLDSGLLFIPIMSLVGASILALATTALDRRAASAGLLQDLFSRNPEAVRTALSVVASSILTFTALVFTVTMLVVQQASNQQSPRVVRTYLDDRRSQYTLGVFMGTFAYTLLVLRDIRSPAEGVSFVPGISVALVFVAVLASLTMFVAYLNHITESIQVTTVVDRIARATRRTIEERYPPGAIRRDPTGPRSAPELAIGWPGDPGIVGGIDHSALRSVADENGIHVHVTTRLGDYVRRGTVLVRVPSGSAEVGDDLIGAFSVGRRRSLENDVAFGFRQLVDIATKALSPGINDPTTAVEVVERLHDLLHELVDRPLETDNRPTDDGPGSVSMSGPGWDEYVLLATTEIRHHGTASLRVLRCVRDMVDDLLEVAPEPRKPVLVEQRNLVERAIAEGSAAADFDAIREGGGHRIAEDQSGDRR